MRLGNLSNVTRLVLSPGLATRDKPSSSGPSFPSRLLSSLSETITLQSHPLSRPSGPSGPHHLSDEPEPHCGHQRSCPHGTLYFFGPCLSKSQSRVSAPIHLLHLSRAGVNQSRGSSHQQAAHTATNLLHLMHLTWNSVTGIQQGPTQTQPLPTAYQRSKT